MRRRLTMTLLLMAAGGLAVLLRGAALQEAVHFLPAPRATVEERLRKYAKENKDREATLKSLFASEGCDEKNLTEQPVKRSKNPNVLCTLPGKTGRVILVGAHFDHVSQGDGVVDNWSGASLLPSLYAALKAERRQHTYIFIGFTDEEKFEVGSRFYAERMSKEDVAAADAMVNMDTLGLTTTKIWTSHADKELTSLLLAVAHGMTLPVGGVNVDRVGSTDSVQFEARGIPSITIHSLTQESFDAGILHTSKDTFTAIRMDDYYDTYRLVAAYLAYLDRLPNRVDKKTTN
jgi:Iap family predicted aminopeptidase